MTHQRIDDIEEGLSRWVGDIAAHQIGRVLRGGAGWGQRAGETLAANIREYLQEESRDLVARAEMEEFVAGVRLVDTSVESLAQRIRELRERRR